MVHKDKKPIVQTIRRYLLYTMTILMCLAASNAFAFKADTHIWIAQQVINDLDDDGRISINFGPGDDRSFQVDTDLRNAILANQDVYRMGNVGPDAVPDIYTGQFLVHPGSAGQPDNADGWQTDDWLKYLLQSGNEQVIGAKEAAQMCDVNNNCNNTIVNGAWTPEQQAFVYGYLGHASSDIFAHTYVNQYSGAIFEILSDIEKGQSDYDAFVEEERHILLEGFISRYNPPMKNRQGQNLGLPFDNGNVRIPVDFVRNRLIFNEEVTKRNALGSALHLAYVSELRNVISGSLETELEKADILGTQITWLIASCKYFSSNETDTPGDSQSSGCQWLTDSQAASLYSFVDKLDKVSTDVAQLDVIQQAVNNLFGEVNKVTTTALKLNAQLTTAAIDVIDKTNILTNTLKWAEVDDCKYVFDIFWQYTCKKVLKITDGWNTANTALETAKTAKQAEIDFLIEVYTNALAIDQNIYNAAIDTVQIVISDLNKIRALRDTWVADIDEGMRQYIITSGVVIDTLNSGGNPAEALTKWHNCWGPAITSVLPSAISCPAANIQDHYANIQGAIFDFQNEILKLNSTTKVIADIRIWLKDNVDQLRKDAAFYLADKIFNIDLAHIEQIFTQKPTDANMNAVFGSENTRDAKKGLLVFDDMAGRVRKDMGVTCDGSNNCYFDENNFSVIRNAITLAKLALLDAATLNEVAGTHLYDDATVDPAINILVGAVRSIDGDHQWMEKAPPYPRIAGYKDTVWDTTPLERTYGYSVNDAQGGLKLWSDCGTRDKVFRKIFKGPLNPTLETPQLYNVPPLLPVSYPYGVTPNRAYPSGFWNMDCDSVGVMVSVWSLLQ